MDIWNRVFSWWGFGNMSNFTINELIDDNAPRNANKLGKQIWQAVKWVASYLIWSNRNKVVFRGKGWNPPVALNEIQTKSFEWISRRLRDKKLEWMSWLNDPSLYLNCL
ncbi:uncharacterized protein [Rutidosis leptorrhynchoides]|uniref:uncharacterized protein n=1 Tax=Rutidosis leptorrhynchoides TaxID=125765 RepID=UPI003A98DD3E